ncbi:MAG: SDR family oxidoreductase [Pseudazoarcus pumilus]|nr:SDR family oxidoreductase [Pseudazoarcus pumilus]
MRILICGANGFIGRHLAARLSAAGHTVLRGVRHPAGSDEVAMDFACDDDPALWRARLQGVDAVVNAVGILIESTGRRFDAIHASTPRALFTACAELPELRTVQISALGVERGSTDYFRSKLVADEYLSSYSRNWAILRPSLVYGTDGASSRLFRTLASLPLIALPGTGEQPLQPVHVDDLCDCALNLLEAGTPPNRSHDIAGPRALTYRELLACYRRALGLPPPRFIHIPMALVRATARLGERLPQRVLSRDTLAMLEAGNTTSANATEGLLGRAPRAPEHFIPRDSADVLRLDAVSRWTTPLLHAALATMWFAAGIVSLLQHEVSLALLASLGLSGASAVAVLVAASMLDLALGLATLLRPSRALWLSQTLLVAVYSMIISVWLPEHWLHPFGPIVKNLPILAMLLMLYARSPRNTQWTT